jgi:hypothetical protein
MPAVRIRRIYEDPSPADGRRILVDRLWPRGLASDAAAIDEWARAAAPSDKLRRWYGLNHGIRRVSASLSRRTAGAGPSEDAATPARNGRVRASHVADRHPRSRT